MITPKKLPSGNWRVRVCIGVDKNGKRTFKSITDENKDTVLIKAYKLISNKKRPKKKARKDSPPKITVGEAIDNYINFNSNILAPSTIREYKQIRRNRLQSLMGVSLDKITREKIRQAVNTDAAQVAPKTLKNAHGLLSATLNFYCPEFVLKTKLPKKQHFESYIPTDQDITILLNAVRDTEMYLPILLSATLSLRRSEICGLLWENVDFVNNRITVKHAVVLDDKNQWVTKDPKTYKSYRKLSMPPILIQELEKQGDKTGNIVSLNPCQITNRFASILKKLSIPKFRFHDLRHYNASVMLALNLPDKYAMDRGGWSDINTLKKIYQHIYEDKQNSYDPLLSDYFNRFIFHN